MDFSVAEIHEAIAATRPDAECLVFRDLRLTWAEVTERTRRLANYLIDAGLGTHAERSQLAGHESGQDHLAVYLHNGNEYLESMLANSIFQPCGMKTPKMILLMPRHHSCGGTAQLRPGVVVR